MSDTPDLGEDQKTFSSANGAADWAMRSATSRASGVRAARAWSQTDARANRDRLLAWANTPERAREVLADALFLRAHEAQTPPAGDWRVWLFMGGRGSGKTWAGARWTSELVLQERARRVALVGPTLSDVREVMIDGPSGLIALAPEGMRPIYEASRRRLAWPNGAVAWAFSAENPDSLRGPQFDAAWCDEIAAWTRDTSTWDTLAFALRLGAHPQILATTTPGPTMLVKRLVQLNAEGRGGVAMTRAATDANAMNLAPDFLDRLDDIYGSTRLEQQERLGELIDEAQGALWRREEIEQGRISARDLPKLERIVVAVDPPASAGVSADACGIVAAGRAGKSFFVLGDATRQGLRPLAWARAAVMLAQSLGASEIVAEGNQGGEMVRQVLVSAGATPEAGLRVRLTHARESKLKRAAPVSALYDQGRVRHAGVFGDLEDQMCAFNGARGARSPDRVDALVWAITALMNPPAPPSLLVL